MWAQSSITGRLSLRERERVCLSHTLTTLTHTSHTHTHTHIHILSHHILSSLSSTWIFIAVDRGIHIEFGLIWRHLLDRAVPVYHVYRMLVKTTFCRLVIVWIFVNIFDKVCSFTMFSGYRITAARYFSCRQPSFALKTEGKAGVSTVIQKQTPKMEDIVNLCKKKGFVHQSSEIYGSITGFYDYGPLGVELKNNIKKMWWRDMVQRRGDVVGLDCSIISSPDVWRASGHVSSFADPMVDCKKSKMRYRADTVFWAALYREDGTSGPDSDASSTSENIKSSGHGDPVCYVSVLESANMLETATALAQKKAKALGEPKNARYKPLQLTDLASAPEDVYAHIPSPATGEAGQLTAPRDFNLMFQTKVGALTDDSAVAYLRPESAQGIFTNFLSVQKTSRMKIPFGIAHIGKAFRNEITPRNFIFRSREFEQMELEYFIPPGEEEWKKFHQQWLERSWEWLCSIGVDKSLMGYYEHGTENRAKLAHYAKACTDITFAFPFGQQELMGVAARGDFDIAQHAKHSGKNCEYFDEASNSKYIPHVIEPSFGVERVFLALLTSAYKVEEIDKSDGKADKRIVLALHPSIAPIKMGVFPLVSNNPKLVAYAQKLHTFFSQQYNCEYDAAGSIGKRYRRADESGTPFCATIDYETLKDGTVTVRNRDSMQSSRMNTQQLKAFLSLEIDGF